jgi:hypothetical protein
VTSRPAAAQHLRDLARLRRVRDRIDRDYARASVFVARVRLGLVRRTEVLRDA